MKLSSILSKNIKNTTFALLLAITSTGVVAKNTTNDEVIKPTEIVEEILSSEMKEVKDIGEKIKFLNDFLNTQEVQELEKARIILEENMPRFIEIYAINSEEKRKYADFFYNSIITSLTNSKDISRNVVEPHKNIDPKIFTLLEKNFNLKQIDFEKNFSFLNIISSLICILLYGFIPYYNGYIKGKKSK